MTLVEIPENPIPEGAVCGEVATSDGVRLRYARWEATVMPCRGSVCILPGRAEFIEKYFETVADLRARGFAVAVLDWRGQGGSQRMLKNPARGHVASFRLYDLDLAAFMSDVVLPDCPAPHFALAHSMGGHVLLRNASRRPGWFERMVLSAPLVSLPERLMPGPAALAALSVLRCFGLGRLTVPAGRRIVHYTPFENNPFTADRARHARTVAVTQAAPELGIGPPTIGWALAAARSIRAMRDPGFALGVAIPVLMVAAGRDRVVSTPAIESLAFQLKSGSHLVIPEALHELTNERDSVREQFWAAFDAFVPGSGAFA